MPKSQPWFSIQAASQPGKSVTVEIRDYIGYGGVTASAFVTALNAIGPASEIVVNLDCPGGDCNDGFTIYDALKASSVPVTCNVVGLAASMGSIIMLAASKIRIAENGRVMIHRVTGAAWGTTDDLGAAADVTKQFEDRLVGVYVERTKKSEEQIREWMRGEMGTWFFGQDAVDNGFADEVIAGSRAKAFAPRWAKHFTALPAALFDGDASRVPAPTMKLTPEQKARLSTLLAQSTLSAAEESERTSLLATAEQEDGWDTEKETLRAQLAALRAQVSAPPSPPAPPAPPAPDPIEARLLDVERRLAAVQAAAGGGAGVPGVKPPQSGEAEFPKNEAELRAAMAKLASHAEKSALLKAYRAQAK